MSLTLNATYHWQLPDGGELYSGEFIELCINEHWFPGRIEYRPGRQYVLILDDGREWPISEDLTVRLRHQKWAS